MSAEENIIAISLEFRKIVAEYPKQLSDYKLDINGRLSSTLGVCYYKSKRIEISQGYLEHSKLDYVIDTVRHELAHALAWEMAKENGHGQIWKAMAIRLGATPKRCSKPDAIISPYVYVAQCKGCGHEISRPLPKLDRQVVKFKCCGYVGVINFEKKEVK